MFDNQLTDYASTLAILVGLSLILLFVGLLVKRLLVRRMATGALHHRIRQVTSFPLDVKRRLMLVTVDNDEFLFVVGDSSPLLLKGTARDHDTGPGNLSSPPENQQFPGPES